MKVKSWEPWKSEKSNPWTPFKQHLLSVRASLVSGSDSKESADKARNMGCIPVLGRYPGEGNGNPLYYSCLENAMDRGACYVQTSTWMRIITKIIITSIYIAVYSLGHVWLFAISWTVAHHASLSMGFPRQEYWNGLPFPSPGDLPNPGNESMSLTWQADSLPLSPLGSS